jgi:hypothetical protein
MLSLSQFFGLQSLTMNRFILSSASFALLFMLPASAATLAPHRAFYDLELKRSENGSNVANVRGKLAYEITGSACDGYAVSHRVANRVVDNEGGARVVDNQMTSWETADGLSFDITQKQFVDSKVALDSRIKVNKDSDAAPGKGIYTSRATREFETSAAALFPTRLQLKVIDAAVAGGSRDASLVYEGSEEDKALRVITFIGAKRPVTGMPEKDAGDLASAMAWPVSMSYFNENGTEDEQPLFQASFLLLENGISTELTLDYGSYALAGKLTKLELLKPAACP